MPIDADTHFGVPLAARRMAEAAMAFVDALEPGQRVVANLPFNGAERYQWHYTPGPRKGLRLKEMTSRQRAAALHLLDVGLSERGAHEARSIIALETALREWEHMQGEINDFERDPELYHWTIFGDPRGNAPWGWRVNGHHLALHFSIVAGALVAPTPLFLGANPAEVQHGMLVGHRTLPAEEDLARALLASLNSDQQAIAVVDPHAPPDIRSRNDRQVEATTIPSGIRFAALSGESRKRFVTLIRHYLTRTAPELAVHSWQRIERAGLDALSFAWSGLTEQGRPHYYAITGPTLLIEYDNTQNNANHIHSVWRDWTDDWGADLLAQHYEVAHR